MQLEQIQSDGSIELVLSSVKETVGLLVNILWKITLVQVVITSTLQTSPVSVLQHPTTKARRGTT